METSLSNGTTITDYAQIARRPLEAEECALIVIDIQEKLLPPMFQREQLVRNAQLLIRAAGLLKIPALVSTQYAKRLGATVSDISSLHPATEPVDKTLFSFVHVASDAVGSRTEWNWKIGLDRMRAAGAVISSTEMIIYELLRSSSTAAFKELLPLLRGVKA